MKKRLQDLACITSGLHLRSSVENDPKGQVALVQIKDLDGDFNLNTSELARVQIENFGPYILREGDVLFAARGSRLGAALIEQPLGNAIATGSFFILRPGPEMLPAFLAWAMNSAPFQSHLRRAGQGTGLLLVRRGDLEEMTLDVPPLETQKAIVALDRFKRREAALLGELAFKRAQLAEAVAAQALKTAARNSKRKPIPTP